MKILNPGRLQTGWTKELKCTGNGNGGGGCGALLLAEQGDVYATYTHARNETDTYHTFTCAQCGVETDIDEQLPFTPQSKASWRTTHGHNPA